MLRHDWDHHGRIFRALAFVDGRGVGQHQRVAFAKPVADGAAVEASGELAIIGINIFNVADVTVINLLIVVVLDLHHLVAGRKGPTEPLDLTLSGGVQRRLLFDVERACADAAPVHRAQTENCAGAPIIKATVSALRFFFTVALGRPDAARLSCRPGFFLPVRVLSRLFRRLFLEKLVATHAAGRLQFFGAHANLADRDAFAEYLMPSRGVEWVVYSKRPFGGPEAVLAYLSRYTHRVAISNSRLLACDGAGVAFKYKDYRVDGHARQKVMRLATDEFIRRFLIHVLPTGFHRIRHYGLFASGVRAHNIAHARELLAAPIPREQDTRPNDGDQPEPRVLAYPCPRCGGRMIVIETFERGRAPRASSLGEIRINTS